MTDLYIYTVYRTFATVEQKHFEKLINWLCPACDIPGADLVGGRLLDGLYGRIEEKVNRV